MMDAHIRVGNKYPSVKLNTTYSFGLDDQDFVVAFETEEPKDFLDLVMELMPSPIDKDNIVGTNPVTGEEVVRKPDPKEPFTALAFKIATDPFVGRLCFFRAYAGRLDAGSYVLNTRSGNKEMISRIFQMHANKQNPIEFIEEIGRAHV